ncbi:hypothetical protein D3C76_283820 [compost metagenome]
MANTSATGGYLLQDAPILNDDELLDFMHDVIVGITGLANNRVRPAFQPNPAKRPGISVDWCAFFISNQKPEAGNSYVEQHGDGLGAKAVRHETFDMRCTFYGPLSGTNASNARDNLQLAQNREQLFLAGMGFVEATSFPTIGELVDEQWYKRSDVILSFRRELNRNYSVLSFASAVGQIITETLTIDWAVGPEV